MVGYWYEWVSSRVSPSNITLIVSLPSMATDRNKKNFFKKQMTKVRISWTKWQWHGMLHDVCFNNLDWTGLEMYIWFSHSETHVFEKKAHLKELKLILILRQKPEWIRAQQALRPRTSITTPILHTQWQYNFPHLQTLCTYHFYILGFLFWIIHCLAWLSVHFVVCFCRGSWIVALMRYRWERKMENGSTKNIKKQETKRLRRRKEEEKQKKGKEKQPIILSLT